eukprot:TRINITY_DN8136_c0_g1_i1.p1 TRINITY_DN8136_c0_g1~~TRINITY_DN8136_c0_g1_i1.p1  ORF type:complete len:338 (+),score=69.01 TRINITY_DN8136_c0_g1_i1:70-1083(+)
MNTALTSLSVLVAFASIAGFSYIVSWQHERDQNLANMAQLSSSLSGKVALIIGGTSGIGRGVARALALQDCNVYVAGRSPKRGAEAVAYLEGEIATGGSTSIPTVNFRPIDFSLQSEVRKFRAEFEKQEKRLDYLVISAGIFTTKAQDTEDGVDIKAALNYYNRFLAIHEFLPLLEETQKGGNDVRVMSVMGAGIGGPINYKDLGERKEYSMSRMASTFTMYGDLMVDYYSQTHPKIAFIHTEPGLVDTNLIETVPNDSFLSYFKTPAKWFQSLVGTTAEKSGLIHMNALVSDKFAADKGYHLMKSNGGHTTKTRTHTQKAVDAVVEHTKQVLKIEE